jgi:hypothetical protein
VIIDDIEVDSRALYFHAKDIDGNHSFHKLHTNGTRVLKWELTEEIKDSDFHFGMICKVACNDKVNIFKNMMV